MEGHIVLLVHEANFWDSLSKPTRFLYDEESWLCAFPGRILRSVFTGNSYPSFGTITLAMLVDKVEKDVPVYVQKGSGPRVQIKSYIAWVLWTQLDHLAF